VFEYHGWLVVSAAPHETDDEYRVTDAAVDYLRGQLEEIADAPGLRDLRWVNGTAQCHFGGFANRRDGTFDHLLAAMHGVAKRAPGSYGLFQYLDDEHPEHRDGFRVLVIRRGQLAEEADPFLSPTVPVIEDPQPPEEDW
jgi:Immunity protein 7